MHICTSLKSRNFLLQAREESASFGLSASGVGVCVSSMFGTVKGATYLAQPFKIAAVVKQPLYGRSGASLTVELGSLTLRADPRSVSDLKHAIEGLETEMAVIDGQRTEETPSTKSSHSGSKAGFHHLVGVCLSPSHYESPNSRTVIKAGDVGSRADLRYLLCRLLIKHWPGIRPLLCEDQLLKVNLFMVCHRRQPEEDRLHFSHVPELSLV